MNAKQIFEAHRDDVNGNVHCQQCHTSFKSLNECETIDNFIYCTQCGYLIARGD